MDSRFQSRFDRINANLQYRRRETPQLIMLLAPASLVHTMEMSPSSSPIGQFQGLRILRRTPPTSHQSTTRDQCSPVGFTPQWVCSRTITRKPELATDFTGAPTDSVFMGPTGALGEKRLSWSGTLKLNTRARRAPIPRGPPRLVCADRRQVGVGFDMIPGFPRPLAVAHPADTVLNWHLLRARQQ